MFYIFRVWSQTEASDVLICIQTVLVVGKSEYLVSRKRINENSP